MFTNSLPEFKSKERNPIWQYRATIPAAVDSITTVMDQVMELGEETALREALANAIVHGCKSDERQTTLRDNSWGLPFLLGC